MKSGEFTLATLKMTFDDIAVDARARVASHLTQDVRLEMSRMTLTLGLEPKMGNIFEFSTANSVNTIHVRYTHDPNGESDLQIGHLDRGLDYA